VLSCETTASSEEIILGEGKKVWDESSFPVFIGTAMTFVELLVCSVLI
jgi:hypothetical protein